MIQTELANYTEAEWNGNNASGWAPIGDSVLVLIDYVPLASRGGIKFIDDTIERQNMASESGVIAAVGEGAFYWSQDRRRPFIGRKPQPGDRVYFERYGGRIIHGDDGKVYRLMVDKQVGATRSDAK